MKIYPKLTVFCPKSKKEQDGKKCLTCPYNTTQDAIKNLVFECKTD